jgi:oligoendopeptidase F
MGNDLGTLPTWDLGHLFPSLDDPGLEAAIDGIQAAAAAFEGAWRGKTAGASAAELLQALRDYEAASRAPLAAYAFAHLGFATDSEDPRRVALLGRVRRQANEAHRRMIFFTLELDAIDDPRYEELLRSPELAPYAHFLRETRRHKPHRLTEPEESILTLKALTGRTAFVQLYSQLTSAFRFPSPLEEGKTLTGSDILALSKHPDRGVRRRAAETYARAYEENRTTVTAAWNALALDHRQDIELRGYAHPMEPVHEQNELTPRAVDTLLEVTRAHAGLARRYYRWKAGVLGVERLWSSDLSAPLGGEEPESLPFEKSKNWVIEAYENFHPRFAEIARAFFDENRVDAPPRAGKSGGAFCMAVSPELPVYVLLNYTGKLRDAATLAHELGHGVHFTLARKQPLLEYGPVLPLAETASVFGELLLTQKLLAQDLSPIARRNLLAERVEDILATTFRQAMYTDFELAAHLKIAAEPLDPEGFCKLWEENLSAMYGDAVETLPASRWSWSAIPHFIHTRFYCYAYTFGELLVLAFYRRYQEEGAAFVPKLIKLLEAGGSRSPGELAAELGYNLEDPDFWAGGYKVLEELLDELESF